MNYKFKELHQIVWNSSTYLSFSVPKIDARYSAMVAMEYWDFSAVIHDKIETFSGLFMLVFSECVKIDLKGPAKLWTIFEIANSCRFRNSSNILDSTKQSRTQREFRIQ